MKNAIVTGGTKGIGLAISKMLLQEDFFVTITYAQNGLAAESCRESLNSISENYEIVKADQSSKLEMQAFVNHILTTKKLVDCLVAMLVPHCESHCWKLVMKTGSILCW